MKKRMTFYFPMLAVLALSQGTLEKYYVRSEAKCKDDYVGQRKPKTSKRHKRRNKAKNNE